MKLSRTVLEVVRGAGGAALALAIGCSSQSGTITREPSARLVPAPGAVTHVVSTTAPPAVLIPSPPVTVATVDPPPPAIARPHHRRHNVPTIAAGDPNDPNAIGGIGVQWPVGVSPACGRG